MSDTASETLVGFNPMEDVRFLHGSLPQQKHLRPSVSHLVYLGSVDERD